MHPLERVRKMRFKTEPVTHAQIDFCLTWGLSEHPLHMCLLCMFGTGLSRWHMINRTHSDLFYFAVLSFLSADVNCPIVLIGLAAAHRLQRRMSRKFESAMGSKSSVIFTSQLKLSAPPSATTWTTRLFLFLYIWMSGSHTLARVTGSFSSSDAESALSESKLSVDEEEELSGGWCSGAGRLDASFSLVSGCT